MSPEHRPPRRPPRFRVRALEPRRRALGRLWLRLVERRFVHRHRAERITLGDCDYKRIRFGDAWSAERTARGLAFFEPAGVLPRLETRFDDVLLVEFIEGKSVSRFDAAAGAPMARFFAALEGVRQATAAPSLEGPERFTRDAVRDFAFLRRLGWLGADRERALCRAVEALAPERVEVGWDYTDAVPKNFVVRADGTFAGIDAGALQPDALIGTGIAKSFARGDAAYRTAFLAAAAPPESVAAMPFIELCFLAAWWKRSYLKGRRLRWEPAVFDRFLSLRNG